MGIVSSSTHDIAPAPHGPRLLRHEPSVNEIAVFSVVLVTEYCIFSRLKQNPRHTILKLNNKILKYNRNPKLLGVPDLNNFTNNPSLQTLS
jgi:hypothetical protein